MSTVICISRECGSGGHEVAEKAAARLKIPCLDKELLEQAAKRGGLPAELVEKVDEKKENPFRYTSVYEGTDREFYGMSVNDILYELQKRFILDQADRGDCIIVGRCAEQILKDTHHQVVNLFITAPLDYRMQRKARIQDTKEWKKLRTMIRKKDKQRRGYYEYHTGKDWGVPSNYDVCLNSSSMGIERIVDLITENFPRIAAEVQ